MDTEVDEAAVATDINHTEPEAEGEVAAFRARWTVLCTYDYVALVSNVRCASPKNVDTLSIVLFEPSFRLCTCISLIH